jgi:PAS domain S-box-containing protein
MHANEGNLLIAELQALLDALPFGIAWMEPNRIIRRCNRAYELLLGFAPGEIIGRPAPLPESERLVWETQESELRAGQRIVNYEGPRLRKDGSQFPALISANPLIRRNGSYIGLVGTIVDHTGRHEQEFEMQILALMVHYSPYFMGVAEREGRATFVNPRGQEMFGLDGDEHVKRTNVLDYFAPGQRALAETQLIPALLTQKELTFETLGRNFRTGNEFPLHCTCFVIPDQKTGETKYIAAVAEDITERMQVESKLKIFCSVVQHSPDPIGVAGMDLHTIFINRAGRERFSLDGNEDTLRTHMLDYIAESEHTRVRDELVPLLLARGCLSREILSRNLKTGELFPALWTSFVIYDEKTGEPFLFATVVKDISESKRIEEELRRQDAYLKEAQKISHTGSWTWMPDTGEAIWSEEMFSILGLDPEITKASRSVYFERMHPDDQAENLKLWRQAVDEGASIDNTHRIVRPNGTIRYVRRLGRRRHTSGRASELIGTIMDVTEQHEREAELQRSLDENKALLKENQALQEQLRKEVLSLHELTRELQVRFASIQKAGFEQIVGSSPALQRLLTMVEKVAKTDYTVLIVGETGTGKELIAQAIHQTSKRAGHPLVIVNCASLTTSIASSELFGHEKGAFTGAHERHLGHFEVAKGGTIFLDEVGELALETQAALLRVLDNQVFQRAGGTASIRADVRVIAATNRDLEASVAAGTFREDLYYRLRSFLVEVPPLRERREDIPLLVDHFIKHSVEKYDQKTIQNVDQRSLEMLRAYDWPGNVRQLQKVIEASVTLCDSNTLSVDRQRLYPARTTPVAPAPPTNPKPLREGTSEYTRGRIEEALLKCHGQVGGQAGAAALLGVPDSTLHSRIKALKIRVENFGPRRRPRKKAT